MKLRFPYFLVIAVASIFTACADEDAKKNPPSVKEEAVSYQADTTTMNGFIYYDENNDEKRPVVLVVHEWWGLNDYAKDRARQLAAMGYLAMAVDMYGNGKTAPDPSAAMAAANPFYGDAQMAKARLEAALTKALSYAQADPEKTAAIGYCFGGSMVLNFANLGGNIDGAVSFHGGLDVASPVKDSINAKYLVCHGAADSFVPQESVDRFRAMMDSVDADLSFKTYENATHAFTNPAATEMGQRFDMPIAYNAAADSASWKDMKDFFGKLFGKHPDEYAVDAAIGILETKALDR